MSPLSRHQNMLSLHNKPKCMNQILTGLALFHLGVGDEHLSEVFEQAGPAERAVGYGGTRHLRDTTHTEQLVLRVACKGAHQLT